jgi:hypothetical protein
MDLAYALADLTVCRAGATTVAEITACGLPSIFIPYPYATARHQEANARAVQRAGGASVLLDEDLTGEVLAERIESLIDHEERLVAMSERAAAFGRPDAAARVADLVMEQEICPAVKDPSTRPAPAPSRRSESPISPRFGSCISSGSGERGCAASPSCCWLGGSG